MVKAYDTEEIVMDKDQNLENENIIKQITVGEWADMLHHTHEGMASSSSVASVLTLISAALADLGVDTTEIDAGIAELSGESSEEESDGTETEEGTEDGESEGEATEGEETEGEATEGEEETEGGEATEGEGE